MAGSLVLVGCGDGAATVDANPDDAPSVDAAASPDAFTGVFVVGSVIPQGEIPSGLEFTLNGEPGIDGSPNVWRLTFPSYEAAFETEMVFEARYGEVVLDRVDGVRCGETCGPPEGDRVVSETMEMCGYPTGELRVAAVTCDFENGTCVADAFCLPHCSPFAKGSCDAGEKCSRIVTHLDPIFGVLDCAPDGGVALGDACTLGPLGRDSGYDDCAAGGICVDGTCAEVCGPSHPCSGDGTCRPVSGIAESYGACQP